MLQGYSCGHEIHRRSHYAFHACCNAGTKFEMAWMSKHGQQNRHLLCTKPLQTQQKENFQGTHGCWLCVWPWFLTWNEVCSCSIFILLILVSPLLTVFLFFFFSYVISGDADGKVFVWDWKTTRVLARWKAHQAVCSSVLWHPHETSKIASAGWDGLIKFWD